MSASLPAELTAFCVRHGVTQPLEVQPLRAGRNSEVALLRHANGLAILKRYFQHPADHRDRLGTETAFLAVCQQHGVAHVPHLLGANRPLLSALYSCLPGARPAVLTEDHASQAARFILSLNTLRGAPDAQALPAASDACFSLQAHLDLASSRIARLLAVQPDCAVADEACAFVRDTLAPAWRALDTRARAGLSDAQLQAVLPQAERILSPSDFGFHNSLEHEGVLGFVDFEYAGWDDPAKLVSDFHCQPELPVNAAQGARFTTELLAGLHDGAAIGARVQRMLPLHRIKWCCILLNELRSEDRQRRLHAGVDASALLETQLAKARLYYHTHLTND